MMKAIRKALAALTATIALLAAAPAWANERPNVVLVYFDDLNDWVAPFATTQSATPNLTAFAARSTVFMNASTASPVCNPSRVAMLTGVHPTVSGVYDNGQVYPELDYWISRVRNLPQHFRDNGYLAAGYGKIFHHRHLEAYENADHWTPGYYVSWSNEAEDALPEAATIRFNLPSPQRHWGILPDDWDRDDPAKMQQDTRNTLSAINFLQDAHDKPFFLALGIYRPHTNWYAAQRYYDRFPRHEIQEAPGFLADDLRDVPAHGRLLALWDRSERPAEDYADYDNLPEYQEYVDYLRGLNAPYLRKHDLYADAARAYLASIAYADDMFGRFVAALDASAYAENTIVIVVSDHGYHLGEKDHWHKATIWERSMRVPFMIKAPAGEPAVDEVASPVSLLDVYPTLVDMAGLDQPAHGLGGLSLRRLVSGQQVERGRPVLSTLYPGYHSVRDDRYRYIRYPDGTTELYDMLSDPWEWTNLAGDPAYAERIRRLDEAIPARTAIRMP